ncbi:MAG: hypothetical protein CL746_02700 [Chloroflexi bacterium]|nr:hypothetical protein [Chloroflexota bacterium]|tara:strand:+ start:726 stop:1844 length:1119 start_codon:yes stop_codon:yes gene_type:complete
MKVVSVECLVLDEQYPYVVINTDEGIIGFGECFRRSPYVTKTVIDTVFAPLVIGKSPFNNNEIWEDMLNSAATMGPLGTLLTAASGIDIALWDIKGKVLNQPIHKLIGGKQKEKIALYASSLRRDLSPKEEATRVGKFFDQGYKAYKMHSANPSKIDDELNDNTINTVKEIRKELGNQVEIMVDVNGAYSVSHAIEIGKQLQDLNVFHFEEPVKSMKDMEGLSRVSEKLDIPIAAGENAFTRWEHMRLFEYGKPDIMQPDVVKVGGITEHIRIESALSSKNAILTTHNTQPYGSTAAHAHIISSSNNYPYFQEYNIEKVSIKDHDSILDEKFEPVDGSIKVPDSPGLGLSYNLNKMRERAVDKPTKLIDPRK